MNALIVIDVQEGLFKSVPGPEAATQIVSRINQLTQRARAAGTPVIFVQHEAPGSAFDHGTPAWALVSELVTEATDHRVRKTTPDSFLRTDLSAVLEACGASKLVVCGYATEFCIDTSVRRAAALGYDVTLVSDAHTTQDKPHAPATQIIAHHNATLSSIKSFGVSIQAVVSEAIDFAG